MASVTFDPQTGVSVPSTKDVRADLVAKIQTAFRVDPDDALIKTDPSTPLGQVIDIIVAEIEAKNAEIAYLANMLNPRTSEGIFLDALSALYDLDRKVSEPTVVTCECRGLKGTVIPFGAVVQDDVGNQFRMSTVGGVTIGEAGTVLAPFSAIDHGAIEIAAGAVTKIVTVVPGWDSVKNPDAGATGREFEPDAELLNRMLTSYAINAHGSLDTIQANLSELDGVLDCVVLENFTNQVQTQYDIDLEPHSIAVCIVGGEDVDIARTLYQRKDAGCGVNGDTEVTYIDTEHSSAEYTYKIFRATSEDFKVYVSFYEEDAVQYDKDAVKNAIVNDALGKGKNPRIKLATTVYASRFYPAVQGATSLAVKDIQLQIGNGALTSAADIPAKIEPTITADNVILKFGAKR